MGIMQSEMKKQSGFTLGEMVTTVAIIGTVAAIAVPQYIRYRTDANMEMVRQQIRIIGGKMIEILGREGQFPDKADWPDNLVNSEDEMSLSASLSAIDSYCYTTADYFTGNNRATYMFCSGPRITDACGQNAGTKRFCVHYDSEMSELFAPGVVAEFNRNEGLGIFPFDGPFTHTYEHAPEIFDNFLGCHSGTCGTYQSQQTIDPDIWVSMMEYTLMERVFQNRPEITAQGDGIYSTYFSFSDTEENQNAFSYLVDRMTENLEAQGFEVFSHQSTFQEAVDDHTEFFSGNPFQFYTPHVSDETHDFYMITVNGMNVLDYAALWAEADQTYSYGKWVIDYGNAIINENRE